MTTVQILKKGRALIKAGWCQCWFQRRATPSGDVEYCAIGALNAVTLRCAKAIMALRESLPEPYRKTENVTGYNDAPGRTKADILRLYDRAIRRAARRLPK